MNGTRKFAAVILWCTIVVLPAIAHAVTNQAPGAGIPAGTITEAGAGSLQMLTGDSFLAAQSAAAGTVHVDACAPGPGDGSAASPYNTLIRAVAGAPAGSSIVIQGGSYPETLVIDQALTITASGGPALVGQYFVGSREVDVPVDVDACEWCPIGTASTNAKVYYPSTAPGGMQVACGNPFPVVVYAHGRRSDSWELCDGGDLAIDRDYQQADGILIRLAASGIIVISVDLSWAEHPDTKGSIVINTIAYLRDENQVPGSWLEGAVDLARVGLSGHSTGGGAAIYAAQNLHEPPFDQLTLDTVQIQGLGLIAPACPKVTFDPPCLEDGPPDVPVLVIHGTNEHPRQVGDHPVFLYDEVNSPKHLIVVSGANHFGYTDGICLDPADGWDNPSAVGNVTGQEAHARQQRTARNYVRAFFSHYLQGDAGAINYLTQQTGQPCSDPGLPPSCGLPVRLFDDLESLNVEVGVCSCQQ